MGWAERRQLSVPGVGLSMSAIVVGVLGPDHAVKVVRKSISGVLKRDRSRLPNNFWEVSLSSFGRRCDVQELLRSLRPQGTHA